MRTQRMLRSFHGPAPLTLQTIQKTGPAMLTAMVVEHMGVPRDQHNVPRFEQDYQHEGLGEGACQGAVAAGGGGAAGGAGSVSRA